MTQSLPTFSIYMETANLRLARVGRLKEALDSIAAQSLPPQKAEEMVLLEDGCLPEQLLQELCTQYPWLRTEKISEDLTYGDQKALGAGGAKSDVVVFADPDCRYRAGWLEAMVSTFTQHPEAGAVAGETTIPITGPFTLAAAFFFFFPRFSNELHPSEARGFYFNNVAFTRGTASHCAIDLGLPLRGGQNVIYARQLNAAGIEILRQPRAQCEHAPPESLWMAMQILYWTGRDTARFNELAAPHTPFSGDYEPYSKPGGRLQKLLLRFKEVVRQQPGMLLWLPIALPILVLVFGSFFTGRMVERIKPLAATN